ncbi:hypothetical protein [Streptomyces canus]|uniref:hypothetical protein n=1 Tax=Streptomyces canus TaxID=58343 RepID=UPI002E25B226
MAGVGPAPDLYVAVPLRIREAGGGRRAAGGGRRAAGGGRRADPTSWPRRSTLFAGLAAARLSTMPLDQRVLTASPWLVTVSFR